MARKTVATGVHLAAAGTRVFDVQPGAAWLMFIDITAGFNFANVQHHHYEVGNVGDFYEQFGVVPPAAPPAPPAPGAIPPAPPPPADGGVVLDPLLDYSTWGSCLA
jgi:hypothetical protein